MGLRNVRVLILTAAAATVLSGCASFSISEPKDGATVRLPAKTTIIVEASPSMSNLVVKVDGTNVNNQINYVSGQKFQGDLSLPAGRHSITAEADVPCGWYCSGQYQQTIHELSQRSFCVADQTSLTTPSKTALAKRDNLSWTKTSDTTVGVAPDNGTLMPRWNLLPLGGIGSSTGLIQSTENSCLCMRSVDASQNTPIGLAICDSNDATQQWQALQVPPFGTGNFRIQNNGRGISDACLTEGSNNVLIQRSCNDTPDQLWSIRDNTNGQLVPPF